MIFFVFCCFGGYHCWRQRFDTPPAINSDSVCMGPRSTTNLSDEATISAILMATVLGRSRGDRQPQQSCSLSYIGRRPRVVAYQPATILWTSFKGGCCLTDSMPPYHLIASWQHHIIGSNKLWHPTLGNNIDLPCWLMYTIFGTLNLIVKQVMADFG